MGTRNFDASQIAKKVQNRVLYGYYNIDRSTNNAYPEQPNMQLNSVLVNRQLGACDCAIANSSNSWNLESYNRPSVGNINYNFVNPVNNGPNNQ